MEDARKGDGDVSCPGCGRVFPGGRTAGNVGENARNMDAMPSLTHGGGLHYLCIPCARKSCSLAREIVALHGGDMNVYLRSLVTSDPVPGDPFRTFQGEPRDPGA